MISLNVRSINLFPELPIKLSVGLSAFGDGRKTVTSRTGDTKEIVVKYIRCGKIRTMPMD